MRAKAKARQLIKALEDGGLKAECPSCGEAFDLSSAGLFALDDFTPEAMALFEARKAELEERRKELAATRKMMGKRSETGAEAVNVGFLMERLAPALSGFGFDRNDCRSLFDPIDYAIFEGLSRGGRGAGSCSRTSRPARRACRPGSGRSGRPWRRRRWSGTCTPGEASDERRHAGLLPRGALHLRAVPMLRRHLPPERVPGLPCQGASARLDGRARRRGREAGPGRGASRGQGGRAPGEGAGKGPDRGHRAVQRAIETAVDKGRYEWMTLRIGDDGSVTEE